MEACVDVGGGEGATGWAGPACGPGSPGPPERAELPAPVEGSDPPGREGRGGGGVKSRCTCSRMCKKQTGWRKQQSSSEDQRHT